MADWTYIIQLELKKQNTRTLLNWLKIARINNGYEIYRFSDFPISVSYEEIKAELATREHIPNKKEGQEIRRQRAKQKKDKQRFTNSRR